MPNVALRRVRTLTLVAGLVLAILGWSGSQSAVRGQSQPKKADAGKTDKKSEPRLVSGDLLVGGVGADLVALVNEHIEKGWKDNKLTPAPRCTDHEFIRRASLDIVGRIATVAEIDEYLRWPERERRSRLIEKLLSSEEFPNHFANLWTNMLLTRSGSKLYHEQMHLWLYEQFEKKDSDWSKVVTELLTATGRTNENGAVNFILAHMGEEVKGNPAESGRFEMVPITSRTTKLFLGLRTQCTQCHDHPFNDDWKQSHFWGINAFFRQVDAPAGRPILVENKKAMNKGAQRELVDRPNFNNPGIVPYERRSGVLLYSKPVFLDGAKMPPNTKNRREELAKFITTSPYFGKAFVNRMWGHFLGRGFTKEVDDFGDHSPVSHPALLDKLASDWATKFNHDPRMLIRWITNSQAYGLSAIANPTNDKADAEPFFSRMLLKAMTPEQLFDSLMLATDAKVNQTKDSRKKLKEEWLTKLIVTFGDDEGNEGGFSGTVVQALLMMNGKEINDAILDKDHGTVARILKQPKITPQKAMHELYLAALNRPPSAAEYKRILSADMIRLPKLPNRPADAAFYQAFYQDLFWAVLNSNEFILNH